MQFVKAGLAASFCASSTPFATAPPPSAAGSVVCASTGRPMLVDGPVAPDVVVVLEREAVRIELGVAAVTSRLRGAHGDLLLRGLLPIERGRRLACPAPDGGMQSRTVATSRPRGTTGCCAVGCAGGR